MFTFLSEPNFYYWLALLSGISLFTGFCLNNRGKLFNQLAGVLLRTILIFAVLGLIITFFIMQGWKAGIAAIIVAWLMVNLGDVLYQRMHRRLMGK